MSHLTHTDRKIYPPQEEELIPSKPTFWENITNWEWYPNNVFLFPLYVFGVGKAFTNRTLWLFSTANPGLTFGSFFGLKKSEVYDLLPKETFPDTILIHPTDSFSQVLTKIEAIDLEYPFIVKPDVGMVGLMVRVIEDEEQLLKYHNLVQADWIAQAFVPYDLEVGLFYIRQPKEKKGKIVGLSQKKPLSVIGNGESTLGELVKNDARAFNWEEEILRKKKKDWNKVPAKGEFVQLMNTGNRKNGARLVELVEEVDEDLVALFDKISHHSDRIFYGRYDIKCSSLEDLKKGKNFAILEFNGVHSGYGHLYHCGKSVKEAYKSILEMWSQLYDICIANYKNGAKFTPPIKGWKHIFQFVRHFRKLKKWEKQLP